MTTGLAIVIFGMLFVMFVLSHRTIRQKRRTDELEHSFKIFVEDVCKEHVRIYEEIIKTTKLIHALSIMHNSMFAKLGFCDPPTEQFVKICMDIIRMNEQHQRDDEKREDIPSPPPAAANSQIYRFTIGGNR